MPVSDFSDGIDIRNVTVRISESLEIDGSGLILYGSLNLGKVVCIYECGADSILRKCMCEKIVASTVNGLLCNYMSAVCCKSLYGIADGCCTGCYRKCCASAFKSRKSLLQNVLCGICKSAIDIARISKTESVCCVLTVSENIRCCLVNRNCLASVAGSGCSCPTCN